MKFHRSGDRRGFALLVALAALVIIGGLIVGAFFASTQEFRIGRNTVLQSRAMTSAEYGLNMALSEGVWDPAWNTNTETGAVLTGRPKMPTGGPVAFEPGDGSTGSVTVTNLGNFNYLVVSEGFAGSVLGAQGRKRLGGLVRLRTPRMNFLGAVTTRGTIMVNGNSKIQGEDALPENWNSAECPPLDAKAKPGLMLGMGGDPDEVKCVDKGCVTGDPPVAQSDSADDPDTYNDFGDITFAELAAIADLSYPDPDGTPPKTPDPAWKLDANGKYLCDRNNKSNWGDPLHEDLTKTSCQSYFPIIYVDGDLHLTGGTGQGILLVNGNLTATGGVNFVGPIIVQGTLSVTGNGSGARFMGGVMAANAIDLSDESKVAGSAVVNYSSCAISKALNGSAKPMFDSQRGWIEMY